MGYKSREELEAELERLRYELSEANETIDAIRTGQIDALVLDGENGHQLFTLNTADQSYRVFIEKMTEGAITLNKSGIILYCNSRFAAMLGRDLSEVIGGNIQRFIAREHRAEFRKIFKRSWSEDLKAELVLRSGKELMPVKLSTTALDIAGETTLSVLVTDLTSQKRTQTQLEANNRQLAEINRALETSNNDLLQFASVASHDLQEPLRKIQIYTNLLHTGSGSMSGGDKSLYIKKITDSAVRMKALITDVLNYSKLSASSNMQQSISVSEVVGEVLEDFELMIQEKNASIHVDAPLVIEGNRGQIRQVFYNTVSNALKFTQAGKTPVIRIQGYYINGNSFECEEEDSGAFCLISIKDNGIGFENKYVKNIFALFERLHSKESYEGTGIGLAITRKIVEKHQGRVIAESEIGKGADFRIILPVKQLGV